MSRLGIFGGTFDPPHLGHLILAEEARYQFDLEKILWVVTPQPPHKQNQKITFVDKRIEMVQAAINDNDGFVYSDVEVRRAPPYYSVDTVDLLREKYQDNSLVFLMGGDALLGFAKWRRVHALVQTCDEIGVMLRPGTVLDLKELKMELPYVIKKIRFMHAPMIEISSREIRRRIRVGEPVRYFLSKAVYQIIRDSNLYR